MNSMKRQNDRIPKEELPRSLGAQYATGDQWRNNSRKNEGMKPKQKQYPAVDSSPRKGVREPGDFWAGGALPKGVAWLEHTGHGGLRSGSQAGAGL